MSLAESIPAAFAGFLPALTQALARKSIGHLPLIPYFIEGDSWIPFCIISSRDTETL